jgi:hypothetical protein
LKNTLDRPFESIESAHEFLKLLATSVIDTRVDVASDLRAEKVFEPRRQQAQRLVVYKLELLEKHLKTSQRLLNDLRSLRRLLFDERAIHGKKGEPGALHADPLEIDGAC